VRNPASSSSSFRSLSLPPWPCVFIAVFAIVVTSSVVVIVAYSFSQLIRRRRHFSSPFIIICVAMFIIVAFSFVVFLTCGFVVLSVMDSFSFFLYVCLSGSKETLSETFIAAA
jgi:hypothetical protein